MSPGENSNIENLSADVVAIGAGGGGLATAVAAAEKGASVIVLEKQRAIGGNALFAEGFFAAESPAQERMYIDARRDECFKVGMKYAHWTLNGKILRAFIDKSGDTVRWLEDKGLRFDWIPPLFPNQVPLTWHCMKGRGAVIVRVLRKCCEDLGVQLLRETPAQKILTDENGRVTGVLASAKDKQCQISAKSVVIGTGGYAGNREMLKKYFRQYTENFRLGRSAYMGDGIRMALEAGADSEGLGILQLVGPGFASAKGSPYKDIGIVATEPDIVWVNIDGERFTDEAVAYNIFESANTILQQPGKITYSLFDDSIKQRIIDDGLIKGAGIMIVVPRSKLPELDEELRFQAGKGTVKISDSWDEIAEWIGADPDVLKATIDEYNGFCDRGYDGIFTKDRRFLRALRTPPYYAMKCYPGCLGTIGGIKINHRMEVLNTQRKPIPGLYAVGVDTGGWESETYCGLLPGSCFGFAMNSGRIAAENAVEYISKNRYL